MIDIFKIYELAEECRKLAEEGKKFNAGEAMLFAKSLRGNNLEQCERLIETLKQRKPNE